jgi:glycosyltransferase involved in cell wall biosynthesis
MADPAPPELTRLAPSRAREPKRAAATRTQPDASSAKLAHAPIRAPARTLTPAHDALTKPITWHMLGASITQAQDVWLSPFAKRSGRRFQAVPASYTVPATRVATHSTWLDYAAHAQQGFASVRTNEEGRHGFISMFPQLAMMLGLHKRARFAKYPVVAWHFNVGALYQGLKGHAARAAAQAIDVFIVHSRAEIEAYSEWLGLPAERFRFVPLQKPVQPIEFREDHEAPFIVSLGSSKRDYATLVHAVKDLGIRTRIVADAHAVEGLQLPRHVEVLTGLSIAECNALQQRARLVVVPVLNNATASGQVALVNAMMYGRASIATRCVGTVDYADHGHDAWLIPPGDVGALKESIDHLWRDTELRQRIGRQARMRVANELSDERTGQVLDRVLRAFE